MSQSLFPNFATNAIHKGQEPEQWESRQVVPPVSFSTTYKQDHPGTAKTFDYSRAGNPTRQCLETCLASLEDAKHCSTYTSGLASTCAITELMKSGDHLICCDDVYGGTQRYFRTVAVNHGIVTTMVDMSNLDNINNALTDKTKMVWIETPTNPLLKVLDIAAICKLVKSFNPEIIAVVDNTFMTPYFQRPLSLGADVVSHSITKYLNGHTDVLMGCAMTNDEKIGKHLFYMQLATGAPASPMDCFLVNRGLKTLHLRMRAHEANGLAVAKYLETDPRVLKVLHPALPSHPQHELHKRQAKGMSGMVSFYIKGDLKESETFLKNMKVFTLAESLGGYESLAELPSVMTHASVPEAERAVLGITHNLLRLSVGIEDIDDIIADLKQALQKAVPM
jgi:cystathionine gamma-lyase